MPHSGRILCRDVIPSALRSGGPRRAYRTRALRMRHEIIFRSRTGLRLPQDEPEPGTRRTDQGPGPARRIRAPRETSGLRLPQDEPGTRRTDQGPRPARRIRPIRVPQDRSGPQEESGPTECIRALRAAQGPSGRIRAPVDGSEPRLSDQGPAERIGARRSNQIESCSAPSARYNMAAPPPPLVVPLSAEPSDQMGVGSLCPAVGRWASVGVGSVSRCRSAAACLTTSGSDLLTGQLISGRICRRTAIGRPVLPRPSGGQLGLS